MNTSNPSAKAIQRRQAIRTFSNTLLLLILPILLFAESKEQPILQLITNGKAEKNSLYQINLTESGDDAGLFTLTACNTGIGRTWTIKQAAQMLQLNGEETKEIRFLHFTNPDQASNFEFLVNPQEMQLQPGKNYRFLELEGVVIGVIMITVDKKGNVMAQVIDLNAKDFSWSWLWLLGFIMLFSPIYYFRNRVRNIFIGKVGLIKAEELIKQGYLDKGMDKLLQFVKDHHNDMIRETVFLRGQLAAAWQERQMGKINYDDYCLQRNRLTLATLDIIYGLK